MVILQNRWLHIQEVKDGTPTAKRSFANATAQRLDASVSPNTTVHSRTTIVRTANGKENKWQLSVASSVHVDIVITLAPVSFEEPSKTKENGEIEMRRPCSVLTLPKTKLPDVLKLRTWNLACLALLEMRELCHVTNWAWGLRGPQAVERWRRFDVWTWFCGDVSPPRGKT